MLEKNNGIEKVSSRGLVSQAKQFFGDMLSGVMQKTIEESDIQEIEEYHVIDHTSQGEKVEVRLELSTKSSLNNFNITIYNDSGDELSNGSVSINLKPHRHYYLDDLKTPKRYEGKGYARLVMNHFESFLNDQNSIGLLYDMIDSDEPAAGMHERSGWKSFATNMFGIEVFVPERYEEEKRITRILMENNY